MSAQLDASPVKAQSWPTCRLLPAAMEERRAAPRLRRRAAMRSPALSHTATCATTYGKKHKRQADEMTVTSTPVQECWAPGDQHDTQADEVSGQRNQWHQASQCSRVTSSQSAGRHYRKMTGHNAITWFIATTEPACINPSSSTAAICSQVLAGCPKTIIFFRSLNSQLAVRARHEVLCLRRSHLPDNLERRPPNQHTFQGIS